MTRGVEFQEKRKIQHLLRRPDGRRGGREKGGGFPRSLTQAFKEDCLYVALVDRALKFKIRKSAFALPSYS